MRTILPLLFGGAVGQFAEAWQRPVSKLHPDRTHRNIAAGEPVTMEEYERMVDYCVANDFNVNDCIEAASDYKIDLQISELKKKRDVIGYEIASKEEARITNQMMHLSESPMTAPVHVEYFALLALLARVPRLDGGVGHFTRSDRRSCSTWMS